jgi:LAS superfamily LD-carboxypeptidase LdcB
MKHITLILTIIALLACTNHKAQNTNSEHQDSIQSQQPTVNSQPTSVNNEKTDNASLLISKEILLGKFTPSQDTNFIIIPDHMSTYKGLYCEKQTFNAYLAMRDSALKENILLTIISATRTFDRQKQIWERKWQNTQGNDSTKIRTIMRFSSMPGTSRHHWGSELDFISAEIDYWTNGEGLRIYNWLCANAHKFGFFQPYTADPTRTGYAEERWHWSYAPLSKPYLEAYRQKITAKDITGFSGSYLADSLKIIQTHVFGITE